MIDFKQYYATNGSRKTKIHYSLDNRIDDKKCVTIYAKDYDESFYKVFGNLSKNESDPMTDYFEKSRAVIFEDNPLYKIAREKAEFYIKKRIERRK